MEEGDFAEGALCVGGVLEGVENLLEGESLAVFFVGDLPDYAVGSTAHFFEQVVSLQYMRLDFFCHFLYKLVCFRKLYNLDHQPSISLLTSKPNTTLLTQIALLPHLDNLHNATPQLLLSCIFDYLDDIMIRELTIKTIQILNLSAQKE